MVKTREILTDISLIVGIASGLLAIVERLTNLNVLASLYPVLGQSNVFLILLVLAFVSIAAYFIGARHRRSGFFGTIRTKPFPLSTHDSYESTYYDVKWHVYPPKGSRSKAWVEGPFCPKCKRELDETRTGTLRKKRMWVCPNCDREYEKPKGEPEEDVRKDFEAFLRRKGRI